MLIEVKRTFFVNKVINLELILNRSIDYQIK